MYVSVTKKRLSKLGTSRLVNLDKPKEEIFTCVRSSVIKFMTNGKMRTVIRVGYGISKGGVYHTVELNDNYITLRIYVACYLEYI